MAEWQPIETAPKDGTSIDLWIVVEPYDNPEAERLTSVHWDEDADCWFDRDGEPAGASWCVRWRPTHWMPIPDPPCR